jgi:hypothetical protein
MVSSPWRWLAGSPRTADCIKLCETDALMARSCCGSRERKHRPSPISVYYAICVVDHDDSCRVIGRKESDKATKHRYIAKYRAKPVAAPRCFALISTSAQHMHFGCLVVVFSDGLGQARRRIFPVGVILVYMYKSYRSSVQSARCIRSGSLG